MPLELPLGHDGQASDFFGFGEVASALVAESPESPSVAWRPRDRFCDGGCGYAATWHSTHCCQVCADYPGWHGPRCERTPGPGLACGGRPGYRPWRALRTGLLLPVTLPVKAAGWGVRSWRRRARLSQTALPSLEVPGQEPLLQDMGGTRGVSGFSGPDSPSPLECVRRELSNIRYRLRSASSEPVEQRQQLKHREGELRKLHLEYMRRRDPFHKNRQRALIAPERALETLQGYVYLHLLVSRTKGTWRDGRASLHFDVFINDERWDSKKRCPIGMGIALHIHSPLSIVRVALMDGDSERDFVGFVEFRVCDLPQCGKEPIRVGDFVRVTTDEAALRRAFGSNRAGSVAWNSGMRRVLGTTQEVLEVSEDGSSVGLKGAMSGRDQPVLRYPVSCVSLQVAGSYELRDPRQLRGTGRARFRAHSKRRDEDWEREWRRQRPEPGTEKRLSAGEICMTLSLERPPDGDSDDEWYALCFPRPRFTIFHRFAEVTVTDKIDVEAVMYLWKDIAALKRLIWDHCIRHIVSACTFVTSWQSVPLSAAMLLWWLFVCCFTRWFLPTLLPWAMVWLHLVRTPSWRKEIFAHQATAPLNEEGLCMVAKFRNSWRMAFWVDRLVREHGGEVLDLKSLRSQVALTFRDGKPLMPFDEYVLYLRQMDCIHWPNTPAPLNDEGLRQVLQDGNVRWMASWLEQVIKKLDGEVHDSRQLHVFAAELVERYGHAPGRRKVDYAFDELERQLRRKEPWVIWRGEGLFDHPDRANGWWANIPSWLIPRPVERLAYRIANPVEDARKSLARWMQLLSKVADPAEERLGRRLYLRGTAVSLVMLVLSFRVDLSKVLWVVLGLGVATHRLPMVRQYLTWRRARADLHEIQLNREKNRERGLEKGIDWAFFRPEPLRPLGSRHVDSPAQQRGG